MLFDTVQWNAIQVSIAPIAVSVQWTKLLPASFSGWLILMAALVVVAIANLLYPKFTALEEKQRRHLFLWLSVGSNLALLGFFKYFNFFITSAERVIHTLGIHRDLLHAFKHHSACRHLVLHF